jgi:hypothetical protein
MEIKNDVKSTFQVSVLDSGFTVLRVKNDSQDAVIEKYPVNQDFIQFHFCLKGQMNFIFKYLMFLSLLFILYLKLFLHK